MNEAEALESMDELTRQTVNRIGWQNICQSELDEQTAIRANFRMMYEQSQGKERENAQLPAELKQRIETTVKQIGG